MVANSSAEPSLDALQAASDHHRLVLENEQVRVLETLIVPGDTTPLHEHPWPAVIHILKGTHFLRRDPDGGVLLDTRQAEPPFEIPVIFLSDPLPPHTLENVGDATLRFISVELKGEG
jgi:hypothetical protein